MLSIKGMHVGMQNVGSDEDLTFCRQMDVEYVDASYPGDRIRKLMRGLGLEEEGSWNADALARFREHVESFGLKLAAMRLPLLNVDIEEQRGPSIVLKPSERDRDIERVYQCIEAVGKAGIPILNYWLNFMSAERDPGRTSAEQAWERIEYFIKRVIPVAEEYKVKMGYHPDAVSVPPGTTYRGVAPVLSNIDGLKRFIDLDPSPYHGLLFCQGTVSEMTTNPEQVYDAIRYFGSRKKIFWVHFRNLSGDLLKFEETFPGEGDIDMLRAMHIYKEVGYDGMLINDHVPRLDLDTPWGHRARAFCVGYIKALIQAVESENQ